MKKLGNVLGFLIILMITLSFVSVVMHYLFNIVSTPLQEIIVYLHSIAFMVGIGYAYFHDKHVRIDIFYRKFSLNFQNRINFYGMIFLLFPFFTFIFYISFQYVISSWIRLEGSSEAGGLPIVFLVKTLILIMPLFVMILAFRSKTRSR